LDLKSLACEYIEALKEKDEMQERRIAELEAELNAFKKA
jgi:transcription elongation GreA/GreB family factor